MRYLLLPLMALALNVATTDLASANNRGGHGHNGHRGSHSGSNCKTPKVSAVPELDGSALPAALTLLAGATVIVTNRRRSNNAA
jgi:hypothetical protein